MGSSKATQFFPQIMAFIYATLIAKSPGSSDLNLYIQWDVGQGQWGTIVDDQRCLHIDIGGEYIDWKKVSRYCSKKSNFVVLTHGDQDHINKIGQAKFKLYKLCLTNYPSEQLSTRKQQLLNQIANCPNTMTLGLQELIFSRKTLVEANTQSRVFIYKQIVLIPGDSTTKAETIWTSKLAKSNEIKVLVLGHHGSQTSTSTLLLNQLKKLKMAIVSARKKVYGHPHRTIVNRLKNRNIPLITTEAWGNVIIKL